MFHPIQRLLITIALISALLLFAERASLLTASGLYIRSAMSFSSLACKQLLITTSNQEADGTKEIDVWMRVDNRSTEEQKILSLAFESNCVRAEGLPVTLRPGQSVALKFALAADSHGLLPFELITNRERISSAILYSQRNTIYFTCDACRQTVASQSPPAKAQDAGLPPHSILDTTHHEETL